MQIFTMLPGMKPSGSEPGETGLPVNTDQSWSQEELSAFLAQLELAVSESGQEVEGGLPWSTLQLSEKGELLDQSGNPLPLLQLMNGQSLPLPTVRPTPGQTVIPTLPLTQTGPQPASESSAQLQMKIATLGEQARLPPQTSGQIFAQAIPSQPSTDKANFLSNLPALRVAGSGVNASPVMPELPSIAVTALDQAGVAAHLSSSPSVLQQSLASTTHNTLTQLPTIGVAVGDRAWGENLGQRIQWMMKSEIQGAEIKLNPRGLGPIEIRVTIQNDQASVSFLAHHAVTREALDATIPRLREMFSDSNINLVNVDVGGRNGSSSKNMAQSDADKGMNADKDDAAVTVFGESGQGESAGVLFTSNGMLDDYA